jgi:hypothetical protein
MERDRCGYAFKCFVTKEFKESMAYINNYCAQVVQTRQRESTEQLTARTDLLSKMLLAGKVRGGMRTWYLSTATEDCQPRASEVCRFLPSPSVPPSLPPSGTVLQRRSKAAPCPRATWWSLSETL